MTYSSVGRCFAVACYRNIVCFQPPSPSLRHAEEQIVNFAVFKHTNPNVTRVFPPHYRLLDALARLAVPIMIFDGLI